MRRRVECGGNRSAAPLWIARAAPQLQKRRRRSRNGRMTGFFGCTFFPGNSSPRVYGEHIYTEASALKNPAGALQKHPLKF